MATVMCPPAPVLITDKSAIESLNPDEAGFLYKHLFINIPPILLNEVLADLSKGELENPLVRVMGLANKTKHIDSVISLYYKHLCLESLLGTEIPMDGRIILSNPTRTVQTTKGRGIIIDESEQEKDQFRWQFGDFSEKETKAAQIWRETSKSFDLSLYAKGLEKFGVKFPKVKSKDEIDGAVLALLEDSQLQSNFLSWLLFILNRASTSSKKSIVQRWKPATQSTSENSLRTHTIVLRYI